MGVLTKKEEEKLIKAIDGKETIEKEVVISWDGKNFVIRFPVEIADYLGVTKDNRFEKSLKFIIEEDDEKITKEFDVIKRTIPKKKNAKKKKAKK